MAKSTGSKPSGLLLRPVPMAVLGVERYSDTMYSGWYVLVCLFHVGEVKGAHLKADTTRPSSLV